MKIIHRILLLYKYIIYNILNEHWNDIIVAYAYLSLLNFVNRGRIQYQPLILEAVGLILNHIQETAISGSGIQKAYWWIRDVKIKGVTCLIRFLWISDKDRVGLLQQTTIYIIF